MASSKDSSTPWALHLGHKFFSIAPYRTAMIVASSLASQVSLLLAFLLPLKIVMLLGANGVPNYMPPPFDTMEHNTMIIVLSVLALTFYVTHLLANRITEHVSTAGSKRLLEASRKIVLFENQDTMAATAYRKYAEALSALTFSLLALGVLGWIYEDVALTILAFAATAAAAAAIASKWSPGIRHALVTNAPIYVNAAAGVGFLAVFVFIVVDFLAFSPPSNFLIAIIAIILGRQLMTQAGLAIRNMAFLNKHEQKISALFLHKSTFDHHPKSSSSGVWELLEQNQRDTWFRELLGNNTDLPTSAFVAQWVQSNIRDVVVIQLTWPNDHRTLIIKAFGKNRAASALHEATLLMDQADPLPAPPLVGVDTCNGFHCHILDITGLTPYQHQSPIVLSRELAIQLLHVQPSQDIVERYTRSKKMLWERLDPELMTRLKMVSRPEDHQRLNRLELAIPTIQGALKRLPLRLHAPTPPGNGMMYADDRGTPVLAQWDQWIVVPQGAGWPVKSSDDLEGLSDEMSASANSPNRLAPHLLAACLHQMLDEYDKQRYRAALDVLALADDSISLLLSSR